MIGKKSELFIYGLVFLSVLILLNLFLISKSIPYFLSSSTDYIEIKVEDEKDSFLAWSKLISGSFNGYPLSSDPRAIDIPYLHSCWLDADFSRFYSDRMCNLVMMRYLFHSSITSISPVQNEEIEVDNEKIEFLCHFDVASYPVKWAFSMKEEKISFEQVKDFQKKYPGDLIAFTVDRVLEFNRSPYFVPRSLTYSQLQTLSSSSDEKTKQKLKELTKGDDVDQRYYGILSALAPLPLVLLEKGVDYINFMELNENDIETLKYAKFLIGHHTSQQEISWVIENVSLNIFAMIMRYFPSTVYAQSKFNTQTQQYEKGEFIYDSFDSAQWWSQTQNQFISMPISSHPLSQFCKFPKNLTLRLLRLLEGSDSTSSKTLGTFVYTSFLKMKFDDFPVAFMAALTESSRYVSHCVEYCSSVYGLENILIEEPFSSQFTFMEKMNNLFLTLN